MKPKQIAVIALIVLLASTLSALLTYRLTPRQLPIGPVTVVTVPRTESAGSGGCVDFLSAGSHTGETVCVSGRLLRVFTSKGGNSFLDFCQDYRNCTFTSVIFASDKSKFGDLETLAGRQVEIHGTITAYQGRAEIIIHDPQQIHMAQ
jgi:hypothetical protein